MSILKREMIFDRGTGVTREAVAQAPRLSNASIGPKGVLLEAHRVQGFDLRDVFCLNTVVVLQLGAPVTMEWRENGATITKRLLPGQVSLFPSHVPFTARSHETSEFVSVSLDASFLSAASGGAVEAGSLGETIRLGMEDRFMEGVCLALLNEVRDQSAFSRRYTESLADSLAIHLARTYSTGRKDVRTDVERTRAGLNRGQLLAVTNLIQERMARRLTLSELAGVTGLSQFHFARGFKAAMGVSPYQFALRCRIDRARHLLMQEKLSVSEVALEVGFFDQSHFSIHFKRACGVTPREFRRRFKSQFS
jgi:AraC family transcriptional regulator